MGIDLLKTLGTLVGMSVGGPSGAAIGAALGEGISSGGDFEKMLQAGIGTLTTAQFGGNALLAANLLNSGTTSSSRPGPMMPPGRPQSSGIPGATGTGTPARGLLQGGGGITNLLNIAGLNTPEGLSMLALLGDKNPPKVTTPLQRRQMETGERLPDYRGTPAPDMRFANMGGMIEGPGTGTSDSINSMIYQNGRPVQEARLSDGEFVMTADAVKGAGNGNRAAGAAKMYRMMNQFEGRA